MSEDEEFTFGDEPEVSAVEEPVKATAPKARKTKKNISPPAASPAFPESQPEDPSIRLLPEEWVAIHSDDPLAVFDLRRRKRPQEVERDGFVLNSVVDREPCPHCGAQRALLSYAPRDGVFHDCLGCRNTLLIKVND